MKYVIAIIQPSQLEKVQRCLKSNAVHLMTVSEVVGCGRQQGVTQVYRGQKEVGSLLRKVKLEIAVNDEFLEPTLEAIKKGAYTGNIGDGKIFIFDLEEVIRIRTGETGGEAIG